MYILKKVGTCFWRLFLGSTIIIFKEKLFCNLQDQPERAIRMFSKMKQLKVKPDLVTYELMFSLFGNVNAPYENGDDISQKDVTNRIDALETDMKKNGIQHSHVSMNNLVSSCLMPCIMVV